MRVVLLTLFLSVAFYQPSSTENEFKGEQNHGYYQVVASEMVSGLSSAFPSPRCTALALAPSLTAVLSRHLSRLLYQNLLWDYSSPSRVRRPPPHQSKLFHKGDEAALDDLGAPQAVPRPFVACVKLRLVAFAQRFFHRGWACGPASFCATSMFITRDWH